MYFSCLVWEQLIMYTDATNFTGSSAPECDWHIDNLRAVGPYDDGWQETLSYGDRWYKLPCYHECHDGRQ